MLEIWKDDSDSCGSRHNRMIRHTEERLSTRQVILLQGPGRPPEAATTAYGAERSLRIASIAAVMPGFPDPGQRTTTGR